MAISYRKAEDSDLVSTDRNEVEVNLFMIGILQFTNPIKEDATEVIEHLKKA